MIVEILYYIFIYFTLFYAAFVIITYYENRKTFFTDIKTMSFPHISMIIPAYNEENNIKIAIKSILNQDYPKNRLKIIVVDDGSTDNTAKIVEEFSRTNSRVKLIKKNHGGYKAAALNKALKYVRTHIVGFMDADSYIEKNAMKRMIPYLKDDKVASVIGNIRLSEHKNILQRLQNIEYLIFSFIKRLFHFINGNYVTPAFALYKTKILKEVGGFEEGNPSEDIEIAMRLLNMGYEIKNSYHGVIYTKVPSTIKSLTKQRVRWNRGFFYNTKKYSHFLFNKKFENLGIFTLPTSYISIIFINIFMALIIINLYTIIINNILYLSVVGFDPSDLFRMEFNFNLLFDIKSIFLIGSIIITILFIILSKKNIKTKKINNWIDYIVFLLIYPLILNIILIISVIQHIRGAKQIW